MVRESSAFYPTGWGACRLDNGMPSTSSLKAIERRIKELQAEAAEIRRSEQKSIPFEL